MTIVITLDSDLESRLKAEAERQGCDINLVASELLANALAWEERDSEEAIAGIQQGLDDFEARQSRDFHIFAEEQRQKYNLPADM